MFCFFLIQARTDYKKERPLLRRKSELPHDPGTVRAISDFHRPDDYLKSVQGNDPPPSSAS